MKKILLIILGLILGLIFSEIILCLCSFDVLYKTKDIYVDSNFDLQRYFKWAYIDIHKPFFTIGKKFFSVKREDIFFPYKKKRYLLKKENNAKRIFILGESVAKLYPEEILKKELSYHFNNIEIINAGMGAYDSYRIEKISKELKSLQPDYVIVCIGNNDGIPNVWSGCAIDPVDIDYLPYKYPIIKKFKSLSLISKLVCPEIKLTKDNVEKNFQKNIIKILDNLKFTNVIFCVLPNNEYFRKGDIFTNIVQEESKEYYLKNIWKNSFEYSLFLKRMEFLKQMSIKHKNVYIADLADTLKKYTNNNLGYNVFIDDCHFSDATYLLLSKLIVNIIVKKDKNENLNIDISLKEYNKLLENDNMKILEIEQQYIHLFERLKLLFLCNETEFFKYYDRIYDRFLKDKSYKQYLKLIICIDVLQYNNQIMFSKKQLKELIKIYPNRFEAYLIMGYIEYKDNKFKKADEYFAKVKELNIDSNIDVIYLKSLNNTLV